MRIEVRVQPNSKNPRVEESQEGKLKLYVRERAVEGKANEAVVKALAEHFGVKKYQVKMLKGNKSKNKIFEIN